jgi:hypothetical protein
VTRLERARRDMAIGCLSEPLRPGPNCWTAQASIEEATVCPDVFAAYSACLEHTPRFDDEESEVALTVPARVLRVRLGLYLRLLRRCEAFDRREDWAEFRRSDGESSYFPPRRWPQIPARPWRPLWLDAPPWKGER